MADEASFIMANPTLNPARHSYISRSTSRSSSRQQFAQARDFDPILRNLSPTTTLRAFSETDYLSSDDILYDALESSTTAQRNLGSKAAQTCLDVRSWARELEGWEWPGTFDVPEPARKKQRMSTMTTTSMYSQEYSIAGQDENESEYWGSLPAALVREYEQRSDEIVQQLEVIDVEELKDFVLSAHNEAGNGSASLDDSIGAIGAATDLRRLDDFTAIITATILQALPYLSRLNRLLDTWTIRLAVLRQAPIYLKTLWQARADLDHGWASVAISSARGGDSSPHATFTRGTMIEMQSVIERKLGSLGRKLDRFLDDLEGRPETVPDSWIEEMESLEQKYAEWIVRAERKILENDLRKNRWSRNVATATAPAIVDDHQGGAFGQRRSMNLPRSGSASAISANSPLDGPFQEQNPSGSDFSIEDQGPSPPVPSNLTAPSISELARNDSNTIPSDQANVIVEKSPTLSTQPSRKSSRSARHVPIILPYSGGDGQDYPSEGITGDMLSPESTPALAPSPDFASPKSEIPTGAVAKKRAIFTGDIERTQSLQRATKTPVRPFEHASNAFARLFKTEAPSPDRSRSSSLRSEIRRRSGSGKSDNGIVWGGRAPASPKKLLKKKSADSMSQVGTKSPKNELDRSSVAADVDAPPVPELPLKSPTRRSMQSPTKSQKDQVIPSSPPFEETQTEPFPGFDFGQDWPLASPDKEHDTPIEAQLGQFKAQAFDDEDEAPMRSPRKPLESDSFDRLFVDSLPGTPGGRVASPGLPEDLPSVFPEPPKSRSPVRHTGVPTVESSMLDSSPHTVYRAAADGQNDFDFTSPVSPRPNYIDLPPNSSLPVPPSDLDVVTPNSVASDAYSPEIQNARVSYFQMTSPTLSRSGSLATPPSQHIRQESQTGSPVQLKNSTQENADMQQEYDAQAPVFANRASVLSLESQPRLEVKSIDLPRRKSSSSVVEPEPQSPADAPSSPLSHKEVSPAQTPPTIQEERPASPVSPLPDTPGGHGLSRRTSNLSLVSEQASPAVDKGDLNTFMAKRRGLGLQHNSSPLTAPPTSTPESDELDRHVSEVLQKLPAPIRFRSGATTPQPRTSEPRNYSGPRPKTNPRAPSRTSTGPGGLTLAPADPNPNRKPASSASEPQVKLYHLTQAGREDPIRLFVRLVGEGQRVMVRVGGGWADLADYLRQYAEHHGSRTVSGEVDVKAVDSPATGGSGGVQPALRRQASGPLSSSVLGRSSPIPSTPARAGENADPNSSSLSLVTPPVGVIKSGSRPSTADSSNRPRSRHGWSELGGSGKKELPESKARWVDGMVERVQKASAEKGGGERLKQQQQGKYWSELGTVGGTRRVVWRSGSAGGER